MGTRRIGQNRKATSYDNSSAKIICVYTADGFHRSDAMSATLAGDHSGSGRRGSLYYE